MERWWKTNLLKLLIPDSIAAFMRGTMASNALRAPVMHSKWQPLCEARSTKVRMYSASSSLLSSTLTRSWCFTSSLTPPARCCSRHDG